MVSFVFANMHSSHLQDVILKLKKETKKSRCLIPIWHLQTYIFDQFSEKCHVFVVHCSFIFQGDMVARENTRVFCQMKKIFMIKFSYSKSQAVNTFHSHSLKTLLWAQETVKKGKKSFQLHHFPCQTKWKYTRLSNWPTSYLTKRNKSPLLTVVHSQLIFLQSIVLRWRSTRFWAKYNSVERFYIYVLMRSQYWIKFIEIAMISEISIRCFWVISGVLMNNHTPKLDSRAMRHKQD